MNYKSAKETRDILKISAQTLKGWKDSGKLKSIKLSSRKFQYDIDSLFLTNDTKVDCGIRLKNLI